MKGRTRCFQARLHVRDLPGNPKFGLSLLYGAPACPAEARPPHPAMNDLQSSGRCCDPASREAEHAGLALHLDP